MGWMQALLLAQRANAGMRAKAAEDKEDDGVLGLGSEGRLAELRSSLGEGKTTQADAFHLQRQRHSQ